MKFRAEPSDYDFVGALTTTRNGYREQILGAAERLPPFSPILAKVLATLSDDGVSLSGLAALIEKDAVLAGNILKLVNSAMYGRKGTVNSVRHAVSLMGMVKVRNLVLSLSVSQMWSNVKLPKPWSTKQFNIHSVAVGVLSDLLVLEVPVPYGEGAFVAGLMHDIGKLLIASATCPEFEAIVALHSRRGGSMQACEVEVLGIGHAALSAAVLEKWNFPAPIHRAVAFHHLPEQADSNQLHLAHVLEAADEYVNQAGYPVLDGIAAPPSPDAPLLIERFHLAGGREALIQSFQSEFDAIRSFF